MCHGEFGRLVVPELLPGVFDVRQAHVRSVLAGWLGSDQQAIEKELHENDDKTCCLVQMITISRTQDLNLKKQQQQQKNSTKEIFLLVKIEFSSKNV